MTFLLLIKESFILSLGKFWFFSAYLTRLLAMFLVREIRGNILYINQKELLRYMLSHRF